MKSSLLRLLLLLPIAGCHSPGVVTDGSSNYAVAVEEFLGWYFANHPVRATQLGIHRHDGELPDWSSTGVAARVSDLHRWQTRFSALESPLLLAQESLDLCILEHGIGAELLELERVQGWQHDPRHANSVLTSALSSLAEREFAPLEERLRAMRQRMLALPAHLERARTQLHAVPPLWVDLALRNTRGSLQFLSEDLLGMLDPQGLGQVEEGLRASWDQARLNLIVSVTGYCNWLEQELKPSANGDFRLGRELFMEKLRLEEYVSMDADALWEMNQRAIERYQVWCREVAREIAPDADVRDVMGQVTSDFPSPSQLIETARGMLLKSRDFIVEHDIVSLPSQRLPLVRATPDYARQGFASMSTPGPFERVAKEAYYNITNVDPAWSPEQQSEHMTYFNYPGLLGITVHEAMPGHFVQLLYEQSLPTDVRRIFTPATLVEGWAHYTEQMMVDEGLGAGDPKIRLGQLRRALQRHARWYAGMALHVKGASLEEVAGRFGEIAYFAPFPAMREVQRASYNPTYLYYALGRMQIFALRAELKAQAEAAGETFVLRDFHDQFLSLGLPAALARDVMLGG